MLNRIIFLLYSIVIYILSPFLLYQLYKKKEGKPSVGNRWKEYFGCTPDFKSSTKPIWIHAVSVGEVLTVTPLIKKIAHYHPDLPIIITTTTTTGAQQVNDKLGELVTHRYMPVDFSWSVKLFISSIKPSKLIIVETELWPNTINQVAKNEIPIILINARLSDKSTKNYLHIKPLINSFINSISKVTCQSKRDKDNFMKIGIDPEKISISGTIKYDISIPTQQIEKGKCLKRNSRLIIVAVSTHPGEDEIILNSFREVTKTFPEQLLIIVPRHPERFEKVFSLATKLGFNAERKSHIDMLKNNTNVLIGDTMGEIFYYLSAADICIMGGTLSGNKVGGHNPIEPAAISLPIISGPSYYNFLEVTNELISCNAIKCIEKHKHLSRTIAMLIDNPKIRFEMGKNAYNVFLSNTGALQKTYDSIFNK